MVLNKLRQFFDKILEHFYIVHIHPNNALEPLNYLDLEIPQITGGKFFKKS